MKISDRFWSNTKGVSLIELLIGTVLVVVGILGITLTISKSVHSAKSDQLHWLAVNIAASKIQEIKSNPFIRIQLTNSGVAGGWFPDFAAPDAAGCNCKTVDWSKVTGIPLHNTAPNANFPYSEIITEQGVPFTCKVCISRLQQPVPTSTFVNPTALTSYCPPAVNTSPSTPYENDYRIVRAQVSWQTPQGDTASTEAQTLVGSQL